MSTPSEHPLDNNPENLDTEAEGFKNQNGDNEKNIGMSLLDNVDVKRVGNSSLYQISYRGKDGKTQQIFIYNAKSDSCLPKPSQGDFIGNIAKDYDFGKLSAALLPLLGGATLRALKDVYQSSSHETGNTKQLEILDEDTILDDNSIQIDSNALSAIEFEEIDSQIENLRGRISRLIPVQQALNELIELRGSSLLVRYFQALGGGFPLFSIISRLLFGNLHDLNEAFKFRKKLSERSSRRHSIDDLPTGKTYKVTGKKDKEAESIYKEIDNLYLSELNAIQSIVDKGKINGELPFDARVRFRVLSDRVNVEISQVNSDFKGFLYPSLSCEKMLENMASKIGHPDLKEEAEMHLGVVRAVILRLDQEQLNDPNLDVLGDQAVVSINIFKEIEQRKAIVERLVTSDQDRRSWTVIVVVTYIACIVVGMGLLYVNYGPQLELGTQPLSELKLPVFGIPWPVALWSFIGSIAAMIYRFNKNPIYNFGNAIKWLLTRPVQGVVLGSTFYLVLVSGLFLLTGRDTTDSSGAIKVDEVILVLSFLVGFSDRFADAVFNTLVDRFSKDAKESHDRESNSNHNDSK